MTLTIRPADPADIDPILAFTADTWPEQATEDYLPRVLEDWVTTEDSSRRTLVAATDGTVVGLLQVVLLSPDEAWCQGIRVHPAYRGQGIASALTQAGFEWARENGATVARNMVFSWNTSGLGLSRSVGFSPITEFRWAHPSLSTDATQSLARTADPAAAWAFWTRSDARSALAGLALDRSESWALSSLTRTDLDEAAGEDGLFVIQRDGTRGFAYRTRVVAGAGAQESDRLVEYGVGAWTDLEAADAVFTAISIDAAAHDADRVLVLIPETPAAVSDAAAVGIELASKPDFVFAADLTTQTDADTPR